jgi:hypothetical protein
VLLAAWIEQIWQSSFTEMLNLQILFIRHMNLTPRNDGVHRRLFESLYTLGIESCDDGAVFVLLPVSVMLRKLYFTQ